MSSSNLDSQLLREWKDLSAPLPVSGQKRIYLFVNGLLLPSLHVDLGGDRVGSNRDLLFGKSMFFHGAVLASVSSEPAGKWFTHAVLKSPETSTQALLRNPWSLHIFSDGIRSYVLTTCGRQRALPFGVLYLLTHQRLCAQASCPTVLIKP